MELGVAGATVFLPGALRARVEGATTLRVAGGTVREIIAALEARSPGLRFHLCYETGELRPFVNVFVNGEHVRYLRGLETPIPDGARVHILPSVAGG
ncbi:MAG: MoaD/ThiS family protein [Ktedonobacterales bacterium]|nr:MoaD/ThiS family protein [Ktedonobacterales bacterium]